MGLEMFGVGFWASTWVLGVLAMYWVGRNPIETDAGSLTLMCLFLTLDLVVTLGPTLCLRAQGQGRWAMIYCAGTILAMSIAWVVGNWVKRKELKAHHQPA